MSLYQAHEWRNKPPETLVVGDGCYARVLAAGLEAGVLSLRELRDEFSVCFDAGVPRVLENLKHAILVVSDSMTPADSLRYHESIWNWVERFSSAGDQHDLTFLFILSPEAPGQYESALALGLGFDQIDPSTTGHSVWRRSGSLPELLAVLSQIQPTDLLALRAWQRADVKRRALKNLQQAVAQDDPLATGAAAREVLGVFAGQEYNLDIFCRQPSHQHGNLLRRWLNAAVTGPVTPDWQAEGRKHLAEWLFIDENGSTK
jgi:hypothetical protein